MGLIYGGNLVGPTTRRTLVAAILVLAAMVLLLWFGSLRSPGVALAAEFDTNGDQSIHERCFFDPQCMEASSTRIGAQAIGEGQAESAGVLEQPNRTSQECILAGGIHCITRGGETPETRGAETKDYFEFETLGTNLNQRCLLPGVPCFHGPGAAIGAQSAGLLGATELQTY